MLSVGHLRRADQIQHFRLRLHHVGRDAAGIGNGVMDPRLLYDMFIEEIAAGGHQGDGIQRAPAQVRRISGVGRGAGKSPCRLNVGEGAGAEHPGPDFRMPGQRRIDIIKQPFAHHKGFSRTAFLAGTTVEAQSAAVAVLLQPAFGGDRRGECRGAEQIVPTAVAVGSRCQGRRFRAVGLLAESRQGVKFAEQGNDRLALTDAGDKGIRDPASIAGELKTFRLQGVGQPLG